MFSDENKLAQLNRVMHPAIWRQIEKLLKKYMEQEVPLVVLDIPLLIEVGWHHYVDSVWVVSIPLQLQIARVVERDRIDKEQALLRIKQQMSTREKQLYADVVIDNSQTMEKTQQQVDEELEKIPGFTWGK